MASRNSAVLYKLPDRIKEVRKSKGMTQTDLGFAMGSDKAAVSKLESGARIPDLETIVNAADAMDIPIAMLFTEADAEKSPMAKIIERASKIPPEKQAAFQSLIEAALTMAGV